VFQKGNQYGKKSLVWQSTLNRAIAQDDGERLRKAAEKLLDLAAAGEQWAVKEIADRLDGKSSQRVEITGDAENPLSVAFSVNPELESKIRGLAAVAGTDKTVVGD
jgi:hypothetical protein